MGTEVTRVCPKFVVPARWDSVRLDVRQLALAKCGSRRNVPRADQVRHDNRLFPRLADVIHEHSEPVFNTAWTNIKAFRTEPSKN